MLGKLNQLKKFISNAVTSLQAQRPNPPFDPDLQNKLKYMLDYVMKQTTENQFKVYHSLQAPQITLNQLLSQIYHSPQSDTDQICQIIHFFTFLLNNCKNQLVICKLVSDSLVLQLTQITMKMQKNKFIDIDQINSYKIALIKAYVSKIDPQTVKYMILGDRMRVLENCISLYEQYMMNQSQGFGVQATSISNSILLIIKFLATSESPYIFLSQGEKSVRYLVSIILKQIIKQIQDSLDNNRKWDQIISGLHDRVMFILDLIISINQTQLKSKIIKQSSQQIKIICNFFKDIMEHYINGEILDQYIKFIQVLKFLVKLINNFCFQKELTTIYEMSMPKIMINLIKVLQRYEQHKQEMKEYVKRQDQAKQQNTDNAQQDEKQRISNNQQINMQSNNLKSNQIINSNKQTTIISEVIRSFCLSIQIFAQMVIKYDFLSRRNDSSAPLQNLRISLVNKLVDIIDTILKDKFKQIYDKLCHKSLKLHLLSLMHLSFSHKGYHQYSVLQLHQRSIQNIKNIVKCSQVWDYLVLHYESILKLVSSSLISIQNTQTIQYSFCQFHQDHRSKVPNLNDYLLNTIFITQTCRNYRFMIVQKTKVSYQNIKLQKIYHTNFVSQGWNLSPGTIIQNQSKIICHLTYASPNGRISIVVFEDDQCLILAFKQNNHYVVAANIRFKSIQTFFEQKNGLIVKLKGLQQISIGFPSKMPKQNLQKFKQYLIAKRDKIRAKQLKFLHHYLDIYYKDNLSIISQIGQLDLLQNFSSDKHIQQKPQIDDKNNQQIVLQQQQKEKEVNFG